MRKSIIILMVTIIVLFSCRQEGKSTSDKLTRDIESFKATVDVDGPVSVLISIDKYLDTRLEYADSTSNQLIIENSLPKGGLKYTDPNGEEYVYAIFWTRITNETVRPLEMSMELPTDALQLPSSPDNYFKIVLPSEKMTIDNVSSFNYGLTDLEAVVNDKLQSSSSLQRIINSHETTIMYVVTLFKQGVKGTVRAGFSLKDDKLYYTVNNNEVYGGQINFKNLKLQK